MNTAQQKLVQYLNEAHATEQALIRVLQSQIAMAPRGSYRSGLETHLRETREHAARVGRRRQALGQGSNLLVAAVGLAESVIGQVLALGKAPFDLLRGSGGEEKVLKNAKDACASEGLEIATYTAIERLARSVGDDETAELAASIRADEEKMLERLVREIPKLTEAVVRADVKGERSYDLTATGAADTVREASKPAKNAARKTTAATKRPTRQVRKPPAGARAERQRNGASAADGDLAIAGYETLTAQEITGKLTGLSQIELAKIDAYERKHRNRTTILEPHRHAAGQRALTRRRPRTRKRRRRGGRRAPRAPDGRRCRRRRRGVHALGAPPRRGLRRSRRLAANRRGIG